ncbi:MAG: transcription-repair coupling factor [Mollicutes bacterium]|nr:transcription-repair coupling factor [Mollicutes bacterium]MDD7263677.1 transcription-repair coupling factor [bacterium]MDY4979487.1 transcription-repair coupling factor [Candidatus Onthovivens sp.]
MEKINILDYCLSRFELNNNGCNFVSDEFIGSLFLTYKLYKNRNNNILLITPSNNESTLIMNLLTNFINQKDIILVPSDELIRVEYLSQSKEMLAQQIISIYNLCNAKHKIIIASVQSLYRYYPSKKLFLDSILTLKVGDDISLEFLKNKLSSLGYYRVNKIDQSLQFASRGDILDVYSLNYDNPIRIEFFGDEIESIRFFNLSSQTSINKVDSVEILPATLNLLTESEYNNAENKILEIYNEDIKNIKDQEYIETLKLNIKDDLEQIKLKEFNYKFYKYYGFLQENNFNLRDFLDTPILIFSAFSSFTNRIEEINNEATNFLLELHNLAKTISHLTYFNFNSSIFYNVKEIYKLDSIFNNELSINTNIITPTYTRNKQSVSYNGFEMYTKIGYKVVCVLNDFINYKKTIELLKTLNLTYKEENNLNIDFEENIDIYLVQNSFPIGLEFTDLKLVLLTDKELFGIKRHSSTFKNIFKQGTIVNSYEDLSIDDYVVHEDYGIGQYKGITTIDLNDIHQDFMEVWYANNQKLYVPLYKFDLIRKYVGREGKVPSLSSLNSSQWEKTKKKIKERVNELADRLLFLYQERSKVKGYSFSTEDELQRNFENEFPYELTFDQKKAISEIKKDMESSSPMDRLLCGDVGFGKTEVAFIAAFKALNNGKQVALLCPTTLLARQHFDLAKERFKNYDFGIGILSRLQKSSENKKTKDLIASGEINFVIGTHMLLSKNIQFKDLGLLIIDEEQRFGVEQKEKIKEKTTNVDVLTLSATPIPRTLQSTLIGLKTTSTINTPPKERMPIQTYVIPFDLDSVKELIKRELSRQGQIFYIHNEIATIYERADTLQSLVPECKIAIIHAKMEKNEIEDVMLQFYNGEIDMLVSTSIVENGIDVRNANLIIVENADKFGLAQLYQIKGRVGRGDRMAYAYLLVDKNKKIGEDARKRLKAIKDFAELGSGYKISQRDLLIRGAGDILGPEQAGFIDSIGIDMYIKILNETIEEKKANKNPAKVKRNFELRINGYIPSSFANDENKLNLYKRIIDCTTVDKLIILKDEIKDNYGFIPEEVETLLIKKKIEILSSKEEFSELKEFEKFISLTLSKTYSNIEGIGSELFTGLLPIIKKINIKYEDHQIKILIFKTDDYIDVLIKVLNICIKIYNVHVGIVDEIR